MIKSKKIALSLVALAALIVIFVSIWVFARPEADEGAKTITVTVVHGDQTKKELTYHTDEAYLGAVLLENGLIEGEEGDYGLYITTVDGETADYTVDQAWWCLTQNGEMTTTGVGETPLADGDQFELTYTIGSES